MRARPEDCFAKAGNTEEADALGIDIFVGLEVIENPAESPSPSGDGAPFVWRGLCLARFEIGCANSVRKAALKVGIDVAVIDGRDADSLPADALDIELGEA